MISRLLTTLALSFALAPAAGTAQDQPPGGPSTMDGIFTAGQASRGQALYREHCAECHGNDLVAGDDEAPHLSGGSFKYFWGGRKLGLLHRAMSTQMPPAAPGSLPPQTYVDILTYILQFNGSPAGDQELPPDLGGLEEATIAAKG